jgi:GT2 family glycosyltransferase
MDKPHVNLIIATPGHSVMADYLKSLLDTMNVLSNKGISVAFTNNYSSHVADAREVTLSGTFQNEINNSAPLSGKVTYDKILWIDSDIAWKPEDVIKLYESDKDIISGCYLFANGEVAAYEKPLSSGYLLNDIKDKTDLIEIGSCGFGFVCVKSGVFESLSRPWFQQVMTKMEQDGKEFEFPVMGEDISWCMRVKEKGYEIWLDPTVQVTHHKTMKLTWEGIKI